jgi:NAD(P)-dependent dehydrogenase (short-subunit alcohol dehydrogenase family)
MKSFKNQVILVTGGGNGIGKEMSIQFAREEATVIILDYRKESLDETKQEIISMGHDCLCYYCDISDKNTLQEVFNEINIKFGRINMLINNAGMSLGRKNTEDIAPEHWARIFDVNFWGALNCIRVFLPLIEKSKPATIVNICSVYGFVAIARNAAYCASKFALRGLSEALRFELAPRGIKVVTVFPGIVRTSITKNSVGWEDPLEKTIAENIRNNKNTTSIEAASRQIIRGIRWGKSSIFVGMDAKILNFLNRIYLFPINRLANYIINNVESRLKKKYAKLPS